MGLGVQAPLLPEIHYLLSLGEFQLALEIDGVYLGMDHYSGQKGTLDTLPTVACFILTYFICDCLEQFLPCIIFFP